MSTFLFSQGEMKHALLNGKSYNDCEIEPQQSKNQIKDQIN